MKQFLDQFFEDFDTTAAKRENFPFPVRVAVVKNLPPRDELFQFALDVGREVIERIFAGKALKDDCPVFVFPERWMSVQEQHAFMQKIVELPDAGRLKGVMMITSSPLIITNFFKEQVRVVTFPDKKLYV
jgi:hypothetical protein